MDIILDTIKTKENLEFNIEIKKGRALSIIGKEQEIETFIELIYLNKKPEKGKILIDNEPITLKNKKHYQKFIAILDKKELKNQTVEDLLQNNINRTYKDKAKRIKDTLKMLEIPTNLLNKNINQLSSGEKQMIALANLIKNNPKIIILKNPTQNLDNINKTKIIKLLKLMKLRYNKTIIIISNDTELLLELSDDIYTFQDNKLVKQKDKYSFLTNSKIMKQNNLKIPNILQFSKTVKKLKNKNLNYRNDINDLIKDIYRSVQSKKGV